MSAAPWPSLVRAVCLTAGRAAAQRALPVYLGISVAFGIVFEGNGVRPADVVAAALQSRSARLLLYAAWTIVSLPAIRALLTTPSSFFLRTLPVARWRLFAVQGGGLLLAQWPWAYLWLRGGGLALGCTAIAGAIAASALVLTRFERPPERIAGALLTGALLLDCPWPVLLGVSLPAAALGVQRVWLRAPEGRAGRARAWVRGPAPLALASSHAVVLCRQAPAPLARAAGFSLLALLGAYFAVKNLLPASAAELAALATTVHSPALILGGAGLCGPLLRSEGQLSWLLAVCGTSRVTARLARRAPLALFSLSLAALHAVALALALHSTLATGVHLLLVEEAAALLLSLLVSWIGHWALRGDGADSARLLLGVGGLLLLATFSLALIGAPALFGWAALAGLSAFERRPSERLDSPLQCQFER